MMDFRIRTSICHFRRPLVAWLTALALLAAYDRADAQAAKPEAPPKTPQQAQIDTLLEPVKALLEQREWDAAVKLADEALKIDPASGEAFVVKGMVLNGKGEYDAAIVEFDKVTAQTGRESRTVGNRANAYAERSLSLFQKGEYLKAIDSAYFAILEKGDHPSAHSYRGKAYIARRQLDKAINSFNRAIQINEKDAEAYSHRGVAYGLQGNRDQLIADQKKALELQPELAMALERMAGAKIAKGELIDAYADLDKALKIKPDFPDALCGRAQLFAIKGDLPKAYADLDKALKIDPKCARALVQRGMMFAAQKKADQALASFDDAIKANSMIPEAYCLRGQAQLLKRDFASAEQDFSQAIKLDPKMLAAYTGRSDAFKKLGKTAEASQDALKVKELTPPPKPSKAAQKILDAQKKKDDERKKVEPPENRFLVTSKGVDPKKLKDALASSRKIDEFVAVNYKKYDIAPNEKTTDAEFVRRIYLDITGTIPTLQQTQRFLTAKEVDKRTKLIDELLASDGYASHYFNYWADVLRYTDTLNGDVRGEPYRQWIKQSLAENKPWSELVSDMITADGLIWKKPATGYLQRDANMPLDNMNNTVRIFLGTRIGCAQCHNHPFDRWTQKEFYQMAAFTFGTVTNTGGHDTRYWGKNPNDRLQEEYAGIEQEEEDRRANYYRFNRLIGINMRIVNDLPDRKVTLPADYAYDDQKPGAIVEPKTLFGSAADIKPGEPPRMAFARWLTAKDNPRFAVTIANRLWKQAFGFGQIEPVDDMMDNTVAENPELMQFLTAEMVRLDFDMKEYLRIIFNSETYQRQACAEEVSPGLPYHFPGPVLRRMSAEQLWDSFLTLAVTKPDEFRELKADLRTAAIGVDLSGVSADKLLAADNMGNQIDGSVYGRQSKYSYKGALLARASELPSPVPPNHFLRMFGQSDRELIQASSTLGSVPQVLFMFNGPITHMLLEKNSTMYNNVVKKSSVPEGVKAIFLSILSREPDADEMALAVREVKNNGPAGFGNVIWSLVNTREFLFVQ